MFLKQQYIEYLIATVNNYTCTNLADHLDGEAAVSHDTISDFLAHASYRVTGNSVAMGEAAGAVAAIAAQTKRAPQDVPWSEGQVAIEKARRQA